MIFIANAFMFGIAAFFWSRSSVINMVIIFLMIAFAVLNAAAGGAIIHHYVSLS